jgi:hypothetical protein
MIGAAHQHQFVCAQRDDLQLRAAQRQSHDPEINRAAQTGFIDPVGAAVLEVDVHLRVRLDELLDVRRQLVQADAVDRRHADRAGDRGGARGEARLQRLKALNQLLAFGIEQPPGFGRRHSLAVAPLDQPLIVAPLQGAHLLADGGLRDVI